MSVNSWRFLSQSADGTSHIREKLPCQDSSFVTPVNAHGFEYFLAACSDGAGTAKASHIGSKAACEAAIRCASEFLLNKEASVPPDETELLRWIGIVRDALTHIAGRENLALRDLACTLLISVIGPSWSAYLQVGDGAIVTNSGDELRPVFWPQSGEYHNTTYFVTDANFKDEILLEIQTKSPDELAMFTDGLQMLGLSYALKSAHAPFFEPMFDAIRRADDHRELSVPLRQFLDSEAVNARTDDDKTLILAVRTAPSELHDT